MSWKVNIAGPLSGLTGNFNVPKGGTDTSTITSTKGGQIDQVMTNLTSQVKDREKSAEDLERRADKISETFSGGGLRSYEQIKSQIENLNEADLKNLQIIYKQKTGRDLLKDADLYLPMDAKFQAYRILAPERIHWQTEPQSMETGGRGIKMEPPTSEVLSGSQVQYLLSLPGELSGNRRITHLIQGTEGPLEEEGASFTGDFSKIENNKSYRVTFQVKDGNDLPEFYTYNLTVSDAPIKASNELDKLPGTAPESELYLNYLNGQVAEIKQAISDLETRRDQLNADIRNDVGNSADKYTEVRAVEDQLKILKNKLPEMEAALTEVSNAFAGASEKMIPLKAVLIARENGQAIPLQLYAKNLGGGKWAIVDVTNPAKPRTWTGEGLLPADALNRAWESFTGGTNDLPAGQIAAVHPPGLGFQEGVSWNRASNGQSSLKSWSNGLGAGSLALAVLGGAALFGPGTQELAIPLFLASGVSGGAAAGTNLADRINNGTFKWKSPETALDLLGIAGGIVSLGGLASMAGAGRTLMAGGSKFLVQNLGTVTRITQIADKGANTAGAILIANQYVEALDKVNRSSMNAEQKKTATLQLVAQMVAAGGLIVLGAGISTRLSKLAESTNRQSLEGWLGKDVKPRDPLPEGYQWYGNQIKRKAGFAEEKYVPLEVNIDGRIDIRDGKSRLSNPNIMRRNFETEIETGFRNNGLTGAALKQAVETEMNRVQIHHIIPDELVQSTELGRAAQKAGYNLDEAGNLKGMPRRAGDRLDELDLEHRGSHPRYTEAVREEIKRVTDELKSKYKTKTLDNVPPEIIKRRMREIENKFRQRITTNQVEMKDGKLAFMPANQLNRGRYEVRV